MDFNPLELFLMWDQWFFFFNSNYVCSLFSNRNEQMLVWSVSKQYCPHLFRGTVWKIGPRYRNAKRKLQLVHIGGAETARRAHGSFVQERENWTKSATTSVKLPWSRESAALANWDNFTWLFPFYFSLSCPQQQKVNSLCLVWFQSQTGMAETEESYQW